MATKISVLIAARKNSKYLAKFLFGLYENTSPGIQGGELEVLVMLNEHDTWNRELVSYFEGRGDTRFFYEDKRLGRAGLHEYFNDLLEHATGDWIIYFCEDHFINPPNRIYWDEYFLSRIAELQMDPAQPYVIVPKFDNAGAMNHMVSRGYVKVMGGKLGRHGWIDSYINDVTAGAWGRISPYLVRMDTETFHDFTHDTPEPMDPIHNQVELSEAAKKLPKHGDQVYQHRVNLDAEILKKAREE